MKFPSFPSKLQPSLLEARRVAASLFEAITTEICIVPGIRESELNAQVYQLAKARYGIEKYWHKRIVRAGINTLCPYRENPPDVAVQPEDILYFDFGPILEGMEADYGRTYVVGNNPEHHQLLANLHEVWNHCRAAYLSQPTMTGNQLYTHMQSLAQKKGYTLAEWHCGHLLGVFPHEKRLGDDPINYICPENITPMNAPTPHGEERQWILEVHLTCPEKGFGGFVEDLLLPEICL